MLVDSPHEVELVEALDGPQWQDGDAVVTDVRGLPGVEPADAGADGDHVEHSFDLCRRMGHPSGAHIERRAVTERCVVVGRRVFALDEQHGLTFEVGCVHLGLAGQWVVLGHGDVVEWHPSQKLRCQPIGVRDWCAHESDADPPVAEIFEDAQ